jgi:hypothetical protein
MIDNFPNIDRLRLPENQIANQTSANSHRQSIPSKVLPVRGEFLKGPIPLSWLGAAAKLPGRAPLATALAIMFEVGRRRSSEIMLTTAILQRFGVARKSKYRALKRLQSAGLIVVNQLPHRNPVVTIVDINEKTLADPHRQDGTGTLDIGWEHDLTILHD